MISIHVCKYLSLRLVSTCFDNQFHEKKVCGVILLIPKFSSVSLTDKSHL